jgi:hypothetical protein
MHLNSLQRKIVIASAIIFVAMGLYPPWTYTLDSKSGLHETHSAKPAGYSLIVAPPAPERTSSAFGVRLDLVRLLVQWLVLGVATGGAIVIAKGSREE